MLLSINGSNPLGDPAPTPTPTGAVAKALAALDERAAVETAAAEAAYTKSVLKMADGSELSGKESEALGVAMRRLGRSPDDIKRDVGIVTDYRLSVDRLSDYSARMDAYEGQMKAATQTLNDAIEAQHKAKVAHAVAMHNMTMLAQEKARVEGIARSHPRLLAPSA